MTSELIARIRPSFPFSSLIIVTMFHITYYIIRYFSCRRTVLYFTELTSHLALAHWDTPNQGRHNSRFSQIFVGSIEWKLQNVNSVSILRCIFISTFMPFRSIIYLFSQFWRIWDLFMLVLFSLKMKLRYKLNFK